MSALTTPLGPPPPGRPGLTSDQLDQIRAQLAELGLVRQDIQRAQAAGVPCEERMGYCENLSSGLQNLLSHYGGSGGR